MARTAAINYAFPSSTTSVSAGVSVTDEASRIYGVVQDRAVALDPTAAQIIAGQDGDGVAAAASSDTVGLVNPGSSAGLSFIGLVAGKSYDLFVVAAAADGSDAGAVAGPSDVSTAAEYIPPATGGDAQVFPTNPNASPPNATSGRVDDTPDYSNNIWVDPNNWAFSALVINNETGVVTYGGTLQSKAHNFVLGIYPVGSKPPTTAELQAGIGADQFGTDTGLQGVASSVTLPAASDLRKSYDIYCAMGATNENPSGVYYVGTLDTLTGNDAPYDGSLPPGFAYKDPNAAIAVNPATVVNLPTT